MIIIANYNRANKNYLPNLSIIDDIDKTKKAVKKQIVDQIINDPATLRAYKTLEFHKVGEITDKFKIIPLDENVKLFSYEELLLEIVDDLTKDKGDKDNA